MSMQEQQQIITAMGSFPQTNFQATNSAKLPVYLTASLEQDDSGVTAINFAPENPVLLAAGKIGGQKFTADELKECVTASLPETAHLSTLEAFRKPHAPLTAPYKDNATGRTVYTGATGVLLILKDANGGARYILKQNSDDKPVNPNKYNFTASVLYNDTANPLHFAARALYQELGLELVVASDEVKPVRIVLPEVFGVEASRDVEGEINLRASFSASAKQGLQAVDIKLPDNSVHALGAVHIKADDVLKSVNFHHILEIDLGAHGISFDDMRFTDMQGFGSKYHLLTEDQVFELLDDGDKLIPAPTDFFTQQRQP